MNRREGKGDRPYGARWLPGARVAQRTSPWIATQLLSIGMNRISRIKIFVATSVGGLLLILSYCAMLLSFPGDGTQDFGLSLPNGYEFWRMNSESHALTRWGPHPQSTKNPTIKDRFQLGGKYLSLAWNDRAIVCEVVAGSLTTLPPIPAPSIDPLWWVVNLATDQCEGPMEKDKARIIARSLGINTDSDMKDIERACRKHPNRID